MDPMCFLAIHNRPAIIHCIVGKGQALLSGVHVEVNLKEYLNKDDGFSEVKEKDEEKRQSLFSSLLINLLK